jgi:PleD family two-component response regulator
LLLFTQGSARLACFRKSAGIDISISESQQFDSCHVEVVRAEARIGECLKFLVVDDYEEFRKYVCALLESQPRFAVVGEAANGVEAIGRTREFQPDVVVLDINMPVLGGIEAAEQILRLAPKTQIIFLSQDNSTVL